VDTQRFDFIACMADSKQQDGGLGNKQKGLFLGEKKVFPQKTSNMADAKDRSGAYDAKHV
jgi:hypothetical protein